jgi:hypothetical protein
LPFVFFLIHLLASTPTHTTVISAAVLAQNTQPREVGSRCAAERAGTTGSAYVSSCQTHHYPGAGVVGREFTFAISTKSGLPLNAHFRTIPNTKARQEFQWIVYVPNSTQEDAQTQAAIREF